MEYLSTRMRFEKRRDARRVAVKAADRTSNAAVAAALNMTENAVKRWRDADNLPSLAVSAEILRHWDGDGKEIA